MYEKIMCYNIFVKDKEELIEEIKKCLLKKGKTKKLNIVSGNPEVLLNGLKDSSLCNFFLREDNIIIPDGVGITILLKLLKRNFSKKIAGIEVMEEILKILNKEFLSVYFLGATNESVSLAVKNIMERFPNIDIKGYRDGFFDQSNLSEVYTEIKNLKPDVLFVAMGSPKQDIIIKNFMDRIDCKIFMGVGGSFDLYSGKVKRAPRFMINMGMEWLYRIINEPFRIKRLGSIPVFMFKSIKHHLRNR